MINSKNIATKRFFLQSYVSTEVDTSQVDDVDSSVAEEEADVDSSTSSSS